MENFSNKSPLLNLEHLKYIMLSTEGRLNRRRYWLTSLLLTVVMSAIVVALGPSSQTAEAGEHLPLVNIVALILMLGFYLVMTYVSIAMLIKRCHDRNRSGHFIWLMFIPIINFWPMIELSFFKGTEGANKFGDDPLK
ncbi:MAG: DUF805 domain-containing protein [Alphaproteobacteria bacterium]|nr:DUF805 domain-containing protein [Alphaproteobacteria bacterium]